MNLERKDNSGQTRMRLDALLTLSLGRLAVMFGVTLTAERIQSYLEPLSGLSENEIKRAFAIAAKRFKPIGHSFPLPSEIIEFAEHNTRSFIDDSREVLSWVKPERAPLTVEEAKEALKKLRESSK